MHVYRIRNKVTGEFFKTRAGKTVWLKAGHAKCAWHVAHFPRQEVYIDDQELCEVVKFELTEVINNG